MTTIAIAIVKIEKTLDRAVKKQRTDIKKKTRNIISYNFTSSIREKRNILIAPKSFRTLYALIFFLPTQELFKYFVCV